MPNPKLGDAEGLQVEITPKRALDGLLYTYVKTKNGRRKFSLAFTLTRSKGEEFRRFLLMYGTSEMRLVDHLERSWDGYITSNPIEFSTASRGSPGGGNALMEVEIEFEGVATP